jgi:hypothetical protein
MPEFLVADVELPLSKNGMKKAPWLQGFLIEEICVPSAFHNIWPISQYLAELSQIV